MTAPKPSSPQSAWASCTSTSAPVLVEPTAESSAARAARRIAFACGGILIALLVAWVLTDPRNTLDTDWTAFDIAADRLFAGDSIYRRWSDSERLPYLYPPPALLLAIPLRIFGFFGSFAISFSLVAGATIMSVRKLADLRPESPDRKAAVTVALMNGFVITSILIGQYSGLWLLVLTIALLQWSGGREFVAGVVLAMLMLKPNLAVPVLVVLVWSRSWRVLAGSVIGVGALIVASLPLGIEQWRGFGNNMCAAADLQSLSVLDDLCGGTDATFSNSAFSDVAPIDKMVTVQSSVSTLFDLGTANPWLTMVWLAVVAVTGVAVLELWRQASIAHSLPRAFAALALFLVAANPRLYFYDGLLVVLAGMVFWATGRRWVRSERVHRLSSAGFAALWITSWGGVWKALNVLTGPLAAIILLLWAFESWRMRRIEVFSEHEVDESTLVRVDFEPGVGKSARNP